MNKCEVLSPTDLEHCCMLHVEKGAEASISAGLYGFLARAIDKATKDGAANAQPGNDMIKVLSMFGDKKDDKKDVHVDIETKLQTVQMNDLSQSAWPKPEAVDYVATEVCTRCCDVKQCL